MRCTSSLRIAEATTDANSEPEAPTGSLIRPLLVVAPSCRVQGTSREALPVSLSSVPLTRSSTAAPSEPAWAAQHDPPGLIPRASCPIPSSLRVPRASPPLIAGSLKDLSVGFPDGTLV